MNKYNSESYAKQAHTPAKRAREGDIGLFFPHRSSNIRLQSCLALAQRATGHINISLFGADRMVMHSNIGRIISIEPTLAIKAEPDYLLMVEQINSLKKK